MWARRTDVVVVGAGPTGLALACTLRAAGAEVVVLERVEAAAQESRAAVVHARTMEVLEELDVTRRLLAEGLVVPTFTVREGATVLARLDFGALPTRYPYTLMLPQSRTESLLAERLVELGGSVDRGWTVTGATADAGAASVVATGPDGTVATIEARFVVGADGVDSVVRRSAGIGFTGGRYPQSFVLADVQLRWPLPDREVQLFFSPAGLVVVAPLPGGHHRIVATVEQAPPRPHLELVQSLVDERGPGGARVLDLVWSSRFRVQHRVADAYRRGPLVLAGDAAHVHSPAGGQGMNTGIQDGVDLGHTLVRVLRGAAAAESLAGYQDRRRPVAQQVVRLTDRATRLATVRAPLLRLGRNTAVRIAGRVPAARHRLVRQLAELPGSRTGAAPGLDLEPAARVRVGP